MNHSISLTACDTVKHHPIRFISIMTKREQYQISFKKQITPRNEVYYFAQTDSLMYGDIAGHLTYSNKVYTNAQISAIIKEQDGSSSDFFWGEVLGSSLYFHSNGTVEVGEVGTTLPMQDFKELLQEWLAFISQ